MENNDLLNSMSLKEKAAAIRFCDCCEDFDAGGYDVPSAMMKRLAEIGLVKHRGGGWYEGTALLTATEDDLRADLKSINDEFLANTNPNIRLRVPEVDIKGAFEQFTKSLPRPDSTEAIEQIKKAVKEFRVAGQPASGKKPSLAQDYQMVAKALGFKTWEALVAVAERGAPGRTCPAAPLSGDVAEGRGSFYQADLKCPDKVSEQDFFKALEKEPYLIDFGIRCSQHIDRKKPKEENLASLRAQRESFFKSGFREFAVCSEWLSGCTKRKTINMSYSSYGLKHMVEAWAKKQGRTDYYVSNGAFIAAAIHMGFDWKPDFDSPNVRLNISKKSPAILELRK